MTAGGQETHARSARPVKRSFSIRGHRTSISLEAAFWEALKEAATREGRPMAALVAAIDAGRGGAGLSSAVRVWLLEHYRRASATPVTGKDPSDGQAWSTIKQE